MESAEMKVLIDAMSAMEQRINCKLSAMDGKIDTMEKRVNDRFDRIESKLDATYDQVSALTESVTVLQSDMAEAKRDIRAIQEVVMQHDEEIITLKRVR